MRDIFTEIFENQPLDPTEAARRAVRPQLRKRFYKAASVEKGEGAFAIVLDGRPVKTPARNALAAPVRALAEKIAAEWNAQTDVVDPASMPLTRLANVIIDAVATSPKPVAAEVEKYLGTDLLCYRADAPEGLVARQSAAWDPVLAWAANDLGARFICVQGVVHTAQPGEAVALLANAIPSDAWKLGAVASITALTGSALLALAVAHGKISADGAWAAAHIDEDWQMEKWGRDVLALERRAFRHAEFNAAAGVLASLR